MGAQDCAGQNCVAGKCVPCADDASCPANERCLDGVCVAVCSDDSDCLGVGLLLLEADASAVRGAVGCRYFDPTGHPSVAHHYCEGRSGLSMACQPCGGSDGGACAPGQTCQVGDCTCTTTADCLGGLVCVLGHCQDCWRDDDCPCGLSCERGRCGAPCAGCLVDGGPGPSCVGGHCVPCVDDSDCWTFTTGSRCYEDGCVVPCVGDGGCGSGLCTSTGRCAGCDDYLPGPLDAGRTMPCDGG